MPSVCPSIGNPGSPITGASPLPAGGSASGWAPAEATCSTTDAATPRARRARDRLLEAQLLQQLARSGTVQCKMGPVKETNTRVYRGQTGDQRLVARATALVDAAFALVAEHGWRQLSIDAI